MAEPITWRSMMNISISDADRPLEVAGRLFNSGLDKVAGVLTNQEAVNQKVNDRADDAQVLAFNEALAKTKDPAEIARIQGQLDTYRNSINNTKIRASLLGKEEARQTQLQDIITKRTAFEEQELARKEAPYVLGAKQAIVNGHYEGAKAFLNSMSPKAQLEVMTSLDARQQQEVERARGNLEFSWKGAAEYQKQLLRPGELEGQRLDHAAKRAQIAASQEAIEAGRLQRFTQAQTYLSTLATQAAAESSNAIGHPTARAALSTQIQGVLKDDPAAIKNATAIVANALEDPKYKDLPASVVQTLVMKRIDEVGRGFFSKLMPNTSFNGTMTSQIKEDLDMALANPEIQKLMAKQNAATLRAAGAVEQFAPIVDRLQDKAFPGMREATVAARRALLDAGPPAAAAGTPAAAAAAPAPVPAALQPAAKPEGEGWVKTKIKDPNKFSFLPTPRGGRDDDQIEVWYNERTGQYGPLVK